MISPSKYVVRVGWSSVSPVGRTSVYVQMESVRTSPTLYSQITAKERFPHVHMLNFNLHIVFLAFGILSTLEPTAST